MKEPDTEISFDFFEAVTGSQCYYMCDFHRVSHADGTVSYRVILQAFNRPDITTDVVKNTTGVWQLSAGGDTIPDDVAEKLLLHITKHNS